MKNSIGKNVKKIAAGLLAGALVLTGVSYLPGNSQKAYAAETVDESVIHRAGTRFRDYGKIEFAARVEVPENATALELTGTELYTCVYINDTLAGERICPPYRYEIDKALQGRTVNLKVVQYSSLGPIFGDILYYNQNSERGLWPDGPASGMTFFGFEEINWILK